ncbi:hypothetical protein [Ralstonia pseudosolanacearum]
MTLSVISLITSVLCSGLAVFFLTRLLDRRRIKYTADGITVIEKRNAVQGLSILHDGVPVERLTKSHVKLWNSGRRSIKPSDVIAANPISVGFNDEAKILSLRVIFSTADAVGFSGRELESGRWQLDFDHWEGGAGVILELLHTSTKVVPAVRGSVDGLQPIKSLGRIETASFLTKRQRRLRGLTLAVGCILFAAAMWGIAAFRLTVDLKSILALLMIAPGELILLSIGIGHLTRLWIPRELRNFSPSDLVGLEQFA